MPLLGLNAFLIKLIHDTILYKIHLGLSEMDNILLSIHSSKKPRRCPQLNADIKWKKFEYMLGLIFPNERNLNIGSCG